MEQTGRPNIMDSLIEKLAISRLKESPLHRLEEFSILKDATTKFQTTPESQERDLTVTEE